MLIPRKLLKLHEIFSSLNVSTMLKERSCHRHYLFTRHSMWLDKKKKDKWSRYFNWVTEYRNYQKKILQTLSDSLISSFRQSALFLILLPNAHSNAALCYATNLREEFEFRRIHFYPNNIISWGILIFTRTFPPWISVELCKYPHKNAY